EAETNALAAAPYRAIGEEASKRLVELVRPLARAVVGAGLFPPVNPIGLDPSSE
ncbi:MAG: helix-turn-helix domain-containing protein, partial [Acidimicrobiales bacterium]